MTAVGIIPARWASTRFPGKPLAEVAGVPMLRRVFEGARSAKRLREVVVATDDARIADACRTFGAPVVRTSRECATGTDRVAEACAGFSDEVVVNVQGDEPLIEGFVIDAAVAALEEAEEADLATVAHRADPGAEADPNRVKVVVDARGFALYFSRAPIPHRRDGAPPAPLLQHVGLYAYRRAFLGRFVGLAPTPLETSEALEQLRALEHGHRIRVALVEGWRSHPVDVPEDVAVVERVLARRRG
jgi:3-deoxy-manno-octulosonate cytidylyltransferase (CMP-KDO synthetase)